MQLHYSELESGIRLIKLDGVLDLVGVSHVEKRLKQYLDGQSALVILDLSSITFLASIGIRLIITTAKAAGSRGGRLVMLNPIPSVQEVLDVTGIGQVIPICGSLEEAKSTVLA